MAAPIIYRSSDASAPVLSGTVGSLIALLDACLVTGYGAKAAAGWTKAFSAANAASYRWGGGAQFYLDVGDNAVGTGGAREARLALYATMTAVATGTAKAPTSTTYVICRKSTSLDAVARQWMVIADNRGVFIFTKPGDVSFGAAWYAFYAGESNPIDPTDTNSAVIYGQQTENSVSPSDQQFLGVANPGSSTSGNFWLRNRDGITAGAQLVKMADAGTQVATNYLPGALTFPNLYDLAGYVAPVRLAYGNYIRSVARGLWQWCHLGGLSDGDTFTASGDCYAGHSFLCVTPIWGSTQGAVLIETTDWDG